MESVGDLLVDWCTYPPLGHAVEGLQIAYGYHLAGQAAVSVVLNRRSAVDLLSCCPWLSASYTAELDAFDGAFSSSIYDAVPRAWDWVIQEYRRRDPGQVAEFPGLGRLADVADAHYEIGRSDEPRFVTEAPLRLALPPWAMEKAADLLPEGRVSIAVMLAGSGPRLRYPSLESWELMLSALRSRWPEATLIAIGKSPTSDFGHTTALRNEVHLLNRHVDVVDAYDLPLLVQLALVERSSFFFSPHTGFGFAVLAVGTPWLTLSGGPWYEYFHIGTPFYSLLPDLSRFPAFGEFSGSNVVPDQDGSGPRDASMTRQRVAETIPEMLEAARALMTNEWSYEQCLASYFPRLAATLGVGSDAIASWDGVHRRYI